MYFTNQYKEQILKYGKDFYDARQIAKRLKKLISERIRCKQQKFLSQHHISSSKALRKVYLSTTKNGLKIIEPTTKCNKKS